MSLFFLLALIFCMVWFCAIIGIAASQEFKPITIEGTEYLYKVFHNDANIPGARHRTTFYTYSTIKEMKLYWLFGRKVTCRDQIKEAFEVDINILDARLQKDFVASHIESAICAYRIRLKREAEINKGEII